MNRAIDSTVNTGCEPLNPNFFSSAFWVAAARRPAAESEQV